MGMYIVRFFLPPPPTFSFPLLVGVVNNLIYLRPNGVTFVAGPGIAEFVKRWQPNIGDIVTFKHKGFLMGSKRPISPSLYRLRPELTWDDVIVSAREQKPANPLAGTLPPFPFSLGMCCIWKVADGFTRRYTQETDEKE